MSNEHLHEHEDCCCGNHGHKHDHSHEHIHEHKHSHDGDEHTHEHSHCHTHEHEHEAAVSDNLTKEEKTLKVLLHHWVDHNKSHEESFKEWVEKSKSMNKPEVANYISKAVELMEKADEMLIEAQKHI